MKLVVYYIALPFIYFIALLPFPLLYLLSNFLYFILYHVIGYRKKVVITNLTNAFPDKSAEQLQHIQKQFYRHLCDLMLETFKTLTISKQSLVKRCYFTPAATALFQSYENNKKNAIVVMGHMGNWEWAGHAFTLNFKIPLYVLYHPLHNKRFDKLIYNMRSRFGSNLIAMNDTVRVLLKNKEKGITAITTFIADQTPFPVWAYWLNFLNQETAIFKGTEKIAAKFNYPVIYVGLKKIKRGYYEIDAELLVQEPAGLPELTVTELHTRRLEKDIIAQPEIWLWSHKRWKHKRS